jgi:hypothetical protein
VIGSLFLLDDVGLYIWRVETENFELIGDTYVCGMMQGEMMEKLEDKVINRFTVFVRIV